MNTEPSERSVRATQHLYLTGYRGCGKSTVAKLLSTRLQMPWVDLDDIVETDAAKTIAEIFAAETENGFRDRESTALAAVADRKPHIVALGGGTILRPANRQRIMATGWTVWLDALPDNLAARIQGDATTGERRPALTDQPMIDEIHNMMAAREPLYRGVSQLRIDTTKRSLHSIVDEIVEAWNVSRAIV